MQPYVGTLSATMFGWLVAALLAGGAIVWSARRDGMTAAGIAVLLLACTAALLVGAKLLYLLEILPEWNAKSLFSAQVRLPGGILALLLASPLLPRGRQVSAWRTADTVAPAMGLLILGTRIGCFLQGCCHGRPSDLPWALPFPHGSEVHHWQVDSGLATPEALHSLPVQPLQLYFAIVGALLFLALVEYRERKRYDGEVALLFALAYFWSTYLLELLRAQPHPFTADFTLAAAVVTTVVAAWVEVRRRRPGDAPVPRALA